jgi:transposase InsO family protein
LDVIENIDQGASSRYYPGAHAVQIASGQRDRRALGEIGQGMDHVFIFNERHLEKVLREYVGYFNHWRPHRSIGQRAPCAPATHASHPSA